MSALRGPQPQCGLDPARERGRRPFPQDSWSRCTKKPETSAPRAGRQIPEQPRALGPRRRRGAARRGGKGEVSKPRGGSWLLELRRDEVALRGGGDQSALAGLGTEEQGQGRPRGVEPLSAGAQD